MPNSTGCVGGATEERTNRPAAACGKGGEMPSDERCRRQGYYYDVGVMIRERYYAE